MVSDRPLRIALFSEVYWPMVSGVGVTLLRLTEALQARGHEVRVYSATYALPPEGDRPEVHRSPSVPLFLYPDVQWAFPRLRDVVDDLARFRPDVVHVATEFSLGIAGVKAARQLGIPIVASAHTDYDQYAVRYGVTWALRAGWHYLRWFYGQAHRVLCPSRIYEEHLHSRGVTHTGIWSRGVDPAEFHPRFRSEAYRARFGVGRDDLLVTYIGRIAREKNLELLLRAWEELVGSRGGGQLVLVGRGPLEDEIRRRELPGVHVTGLLRGRELSEPYASADVFTFPSPTETFGN
jgi:glycosyltransferase involved in cell wall biosynthesis